MRVPLVLASIGSLGLGLAGCENARREPPAGAMTLAGQEVSAEVLRTGHEAYMLYCYACHGEQGDGQGPAAKGLRPPPRDLRMGVYKFGGVVDGLPHDEDFERIIMGGLGEGTGMRPWRVPKPQLAGMVQYIKTFSEAWTDPDAELGQRVVPKEDPWKSRAGEAVARGSKIYHGLATCQQCHPAYVTKQEIFAASKELKGTGITDFRPGLGRSEAKESEYKVGDVKMRIVPPDFTWHPLRSIRAGSELDDLFRTIGAGIPGTAMPAWYGSLADEDLWAMAHYVKSLMDLRDRPGAAALRAALDGQPEFVPPAEPPPAGEPPGGPSGSTAGGAPPAKGAAAGLDADAAPDPA
jgi:mono/diheme cytochrome c family protein